MTLSVSETANLQIFRDEAGANVAKLFVGESDTIRQVMEVIDDAANHGLVSGIALVVDSDGELLGLVTDGDLRRAILADVPLSAEVGSIATRNPIVFPDHLSYREILEAIPETLRRSHRYGGTNRLEKVVLVDHLGQPTRVLDFVDLWNRQSTRSRRVAVVGLGYVGLTLAVTLAEFRYEVTCVDADEDIRKSVSDGHPHFYEAGLESLLRRHLDREMVVAAEVPPDAEVYIIAVGTPVGPDRQPDLSAIRAASHAVSKVLKPGDLVILRSTVPLGTCRQVVLPILEESRLKGGRDFYLAFAPERTIEGKALQELRSLPQVIGGLGQNSTDLAANFFREFAPSTVSLSSLEAAELVKLANNGFRDVIFGFANQLVQVCSKHNLSASEVIAAANKGYPRDPIPLPSPGVGGMCLTKDPYLLAHAADEAGIADSLSLRARRINESIPALLAHQIRDALARLDKSPKDAKVFMMGFAFKGQPETSDTRFSTSLDLLRELRRFVPRVQGYDPVVGPEALAKLDGVDPVSVEEGFKDADVVIVANNHSSYRYMDLLGLLETTRRPAVYCDFWDVFSPHDVRQVEGITYLGLGYSIPAD
jgi:UDP-N-acetyl-D-mannosaminuronic acid dehydrogenase